MAFVNSVKDIMPGMGSPSTYLKRESVATNVGTVNITVPSSGTFASNGAGTTVSAGRIRVKSESIVTGGTVQFGGATATDGSTTVNLCPQQTALGANVLMDFSFDFRIDINATSITVTVIAGTQNSVHSVEITGVP